jgi:hypothetical protein
MTLRAYRFRRNAKEIAPLPPAEACPHKQPQTIPNSAKLPYFGGCSKPSAVSVKARIPVLIAIS